MAQPNTNRTLYFIPDSRPSAADVTRANKIPGTVYFRNVSEDDGRVEASEFVTAASGVTIPTQYNAVTRYSPEKPISLEIVPNTLSIDLSDTEHADLRAIARFSDGSAVDVTTSCAWVSGTPAKATIGAATGIATPLEAGDTIITATYAWAAPGEAGVVYATKALTASSNPAADDTVAMGGVTYTYKAEVTTVANQVKVGATKEESLENLRRAVNAEPGAGDVYGSLTDINPQVSATLAGAVLTATAKTPGTAGNAVVLAESSSALAWASGATALSGGTNATAAVADTMTLTVVA